MLREADAVEPGVDGGLRIAFGHQAHAVERVQSRQDSRARHVGDRSARAAAVFESPIAFWKLCGALHGEDSGFVLVENRPELGFIPRRIAGCGRPVDEFQKVEKKRGLDLVLQMISAFSRAEGA